MAKKHKNKIGIWDYIVWIVLILSGLFLYYANIQRTNAGYWNDPTWITLKDFSYIIFFGLFVGYAIAIILRKTNRK